MSSDLARSICVSIFTSVPTLPSLCAAGRTAARLRLWLARADEGAGDLAVDVRRDALDVNAGLGEKCTGIINPIHAPWLDRSIDKSGGLQFRDVLVVAECARDAPDPELQAAPDRRRNVAAHDDV